MTSTTWWEAPQASGQIAATLITAPSGVKVCVLGSESPGSWQSLSDGDFAEVSQVTDLTSADIVRVTAVVRGRADPRAGWSTDDLAGVFDASLSDQGVTRLPPWVEVECGSAGRSSRQDASTVVTGYLPNAARSYSPDGVTRGLLVEPAATNLAAVGAPVGWSTVTGTPLFNEVETPDGSTGFAEVEDDDAGVVEEVREALADTIAATTYTLSGWLWNTEAEDATLRVEHDGTGTLAQVTVSTVDEGWVHHSVTATPGAATPVSVRATPRAGAASDVGSARYWGIQWETGAYPTSWVEEVSGSSDRAADRVVLRPGMVVEGGWFDVEVQYLPLYAHDETAADHNLLYFDADNRLYFRQSDQRFVLRLNGVDLATTNAHTFSRLQALTVRAVHSDAERRIVVTGATTGDGETTAAAGAQLVPGPRVRLMGGLSGAEEGAVVLRVETGVSAPEPWTLSLLSDSVETASVPVSPGDDLVYRDIAAVVTDSGTASSEIVYRLEFRSESWAPETVEVPLVALDSVALQDAGDELALANRVPEDGWQGVPVTTTISLDLAEVSSSLTPPGAAATQVYVDDVLAFDGGVFQAGWSGPASGTSFPQADVLRIVVDPETDLSDGEVHTVRVVSVLGGSAIDATYSFETVDATGPVLLRAFARSRFVVRATFDEEVGDDALAGDGYSLSLVQGEAQTRLPAVTGSILTVVSGVRVTASEVDLTLAAEPTARATYTLTATVSDDDGNTGESSADFVAYQPYTDARRRYDYLRLVPAQALALDETGDLRNFLLCLQEVGEVLLYDADAFPDLLDPDFAPIAFVEAMLVDLGNPFRFALTDTEKRKLAKLLTPVMRGKGTDERIIDAIRLLVGVEVEIVDLTGDEPGLGYFQIGVGWVLASGELADKYTMLIVSPVVLTEQQRDRIDKIVAYMRRAPCHWRIVAPEPVADPVHWALGYSYLGVTTTLHA